jgi:hypothetical protein
VKATSANKYHKELYILEAVDWKKEHFGALFISFKVLTF